MTAAEIAALSDRALDRAISTALPAFEPERWQCSACGYRYAVMGATKTRPKETITSCLNCHWVGPPEEARPWYSGPDWGPVGRLVEYCAGTRNFRIGYVTSPPWTPTVTDGTASIVWPKDRPPLHTVVLFVDAACGPRAISEAILQALQKEEDHVD